MTVLWANKSAVGKRGMLGRPLMSAEEVHHLNEVRRDNWPVNLVVCSTRWHSFLHRRGSYRHSALPCARQARVACACGCGQKIWRLAGGGRVRRYAPGHANRLTGQRRLRCRQMARRASVNKGVCS